MNFLNIFKAFLWFALLGGALGLLLAFASKIFAVKQDERIEKIRALLPGANCGGCGFSGCDAYAEAIVNDGAAIVKCGVGGSETAKKVAEIMGVEAEESVRMHAQVMCSGYTDIAKKKYTYDGIKDCYAAEKLGGGDKTCPNGCIGLGTCVSKCAFDAIKVVNGVAEVDCGKCTGCGACVNACPKHIIKLIPYEAQYWVGCMSVDKGGVTRSYCDAGCISCRLCEKGCPSGAITVNDFVASIDYSKCISCGKCVEKCPRHIIKSSKAVSST